MNLKSNITRYLCISTAGTLLLTTLFSWWLASDSIHAWTKARNNLVQFDDFNKILTVSNDLASERAFANELILSDAATKQSAWASLKKSREVTDAAIAKIPHKFLTHSLLNATKVQLINSRRTVDRYQTVQPRDPVAEQHAIDEMVAATNFYHQALYRKTSEFIRLEPAELGPVLRAQALGELRDATGLLGAAILVPLQNKVPLSSAQLTSLSRGFERINMQWWILDTHGSEISANSRFTELLAQTRHRFESQGMTLIEELKKQSDNGASYTMDADVFAVKYHSSLKSFNSLLNVYLSDLKQNYIASENRAMMNLMLVCCILLVLYILVIGAVYYIRTRVLMPIIKLNEITHGLISGDRKTIELLTNNSAGEVQQLWSSLGALGNKLNEQAEMSEQFKKSSEEDPLTSLLNRRAFEKLASDIAGRASESNLAWVVLIDIDHFKSINDTWGHPAGDAVLVAFAAMLKNVCRGEDVVARIGGEEFAVVFQNGDTDAALKYAFRLLEQIRSLEIPVQANETLRLTASLGIASGYHKTLPELLSEADLELYKAKNNGRDRICYQSARATNEG